MSSSQTKELSSLLSAAANATRGGRTSRYVDFGVELRVVAGDPAGQVWIAGKPPLRVLRRHRLGGRWDCKLRRFGGECRRWTVWYVSERQEAIVLNEDPARTRTLLYSAEGGGKTVTCAMWAIVQVIKLALAGSFVAGGVTAPTHQRLQHVVKAITERIPSDTPRKRSESSVATYFSDQGELRFITGHVLQFRSTKKASEATGSPIQGFTWAFSVDDELQDTVANGADPDIEARLRGVKVTRRLCSATAKDSPTWRSFRDLKLSTPDWAIERIRFDENPFEWAERWERMKRQVSAREWQRRGLALDVGPERMTYTAWDRAQNLRTIPQIGADDVTADVLRSWGGNFGVLVGHDPGKLFDVSLILKAYKLRGQPRHAWFVVDEVTTEQTTTEQHVVALLKVLNEKWQCNLRDWRGDAGQGKQAFIRADPYSNTGNDASSPDRTVYTTFRRHGLRIEAAAYTASTSQIKVARIPKDAGIGMVNGLLCNATGERRLFIACDDQRQPAAPRLVEAIEMSERNGDGEAEAQDKNKYDLSHWPASLRYALWALEKPRMSEAA